MRKDLLKEILAVPTVSRNEKQMVAWLTRYIKKLGLTYETDELGNILVTKGEPPEGKTYPLICAHTDSVHPIKNTVIVEHDGCVWAVDPVTRDSTGCGGDDKCGIFICLELLERFECLKVAFFVSEEIYCVGSKAANGEFFKDVGYCLEFDSPHGDIISFSCDGVQLFEEEGEFAQLVTPIMDEHKVDKWQAHPYTDVAILKRRFDFTCINLPAGYYRMHSAHEYVKLADVQNTILMAEKMLKLLGYRKFPYACNEVGYRRNTKRKVTGLVLEGA